MRKTRENSLSGDVPFLEGEKQYINFQDAECKASDLQLMYCGKERCHPGHKYGPNKRDVYLIHIVYSGSGTLCVNGELYQLSAGNAFLLYPHTLAWYEADLKDLTSGWHVEESMQIPSCPMPALVPQSPFASCTMCKIFSNTLIRF